MQEFLKILLRFKEQVGVQTDKEVAELLGLLPTSFNDRKKRGNFPVDKLYALIAKRPDLLIDGTYVLTGDYDSVLAAKMSVSRHEARQALGSGAQKAKASELKRREEALLLNYRAATEPGKIAIEATAKAVEKSKTRR